MSPSLYTYRVILYTFLAIVSCVLFGLCAARLYYTTHLSKHDPLNHGIPFHDPIVAELIVTAFLTLLWGSSMSCIIGSRSERGLISRFRGEFIGLFILWLMWLVGAAYSSHLWGNLKSCWSYKACRILTALVAFSWIGWIVLTLLAIMSICFVWANEAFQEPLHGRYWFDSEGRRISRGPEMTQRA
ncbi:hypothetical protein DL96DRAFT_235045 [Flagelloscypha sp. PMI_526]|nr:hypothetical protein DL96DRAFT_235045 [Flagelloscypha sp. PMI_526]